MLSRPYPYAGNHTAAYERLWVYGYLKSKSSLMVFDRHANLKYKYGNRHFWCRGYYVDTVGKYENAIKNYIKNQLQEDIIEDQLSLKEFVDPFTGSGVKKANKNAPRVGGLPVIIVWLSEPIRCTF